MEIYVWKLNGNFFEAKAVIDFAQSVIWVTRYTAAGEFELYLPATTELVALFEGETLLSRADTYTAMLAERAEVQTDPEEGDHLIVSGRSAESLIGRRIVSRQKTFGREPANFIMNGLVSDEVISMGVPARSIPCIRLAGGSPAPLGLINGMQITGKNVLEKLTEIGVQQNIGFCLAWCKTGTGYFDFETFRGQDRTRQVIFSPDFENLGATDYSEDSTEHFTCAYVAGQGQGVDRIIVTTDDGTTGIARREVWVDARNTSPQTDSGTMTDEEYREILAQEGEETLAAGKVEVHFNGEILNTNGYVYGVDYGLGDIVTVRTGYGLTTTARVTEITEVEDEDGYKLIPTLAEMEV